MAGVPDKGLVTLGPWPAGMNNLAKEGALPADENGHSVALRDAENVDLDKAGYASRRDGYARAYTGTLVHSAWGSPLLPFGLFVDAGQLHALYETGEVEPLGVQVGGVPLSYALFNDRVFFTSPTVSGLVGLDLFVHAWAPDEPDGQPDAAAVAGMSLAAGQYQVAITFTDVLGRESGSTLAVVVDVAEGQGIALTHIPQPIDLTATPTINLYLTDADDQVLRLYGSMPSGVNTASIGQQAKGRVLATQFLVTMPAGQIVRLHNGRQFVADGRHLRWSPALRYGLTDPARNVIHFRDEITLMEPVGAGGPGAGIFVGAGGRVFWLGGTDPSAFNQRIAHGSGVIPRSSCMVRGSALGLASQEDVPVWLSRRGNFCVGLEGGTIRSLHDGRAITDDATSAASMYREHNGKLQVITTMVGARKQGLQVTDRAVAHVIPTT